MKNELRIGNLIDLGNRIAKIVEIGHLSCVVVDLEETQDTIEDYERVKPIPLTEEWLVRFGFDFRGVNSTMGYTSTQCVFNSFLIFYNTHSGMGYTTVGEDEFCYHNTKIKYVHQLQNLYFALTGNELTITN